MKSAFAMAKRSTARIVALYMVSLVMHAGVATADPVSIQIKTATLLNSEDEIVEVDGGLYLNDEATVIVQKTLNSLSTQNKDLIVKLESANKKILDCAPYIAGLPAWAYTVISVGLTALTAGVAYFAARDATK